jgi:hypothetical protein
LVVDIVVDYLVGTEIIVVRVVGLRSLSSLIFVVRRAPSAICDENVSGSLRSTGYRPGLTVCSQLLPTFLTPFRMVGNSVPTRIA